jgi:hypothetical protein
MTGWVFIVIRHLYIHINVYRPSCNQQATSSYLFLVIFISQNSLPLPNSWCCHHISEHLNVQFLSRLLPSYIHYHSFIWRHRTHQLKKGVVQLPNISESEFIKMWISCSLLLSLHHWLIRRPIPSAYFAITKKRNEQRVLFRILYKWLA